VEGIADDVEGNIFSRFRFTSLSHFSFGMVHNEGVAEIVYYVTRLDHGEYVLRRSDSLYPFAEFEEKNTDPIVCKQIQEFSVTYYDNEGEEYEEWDSESSEYDYATPRFVQIDLQIGEKDAPMAFHTRINIPVYREKPASMS
jgi:general secretion pathway protein J